MYRGSAFLARGPSSNHSSRVGFPAMPDGLSWGKINSDQCQVFWKEICVSDVCDQRTFCCAAKHKFFVYDKKVTFFCISRVYHPINILCVARVKKNIVLGGAKHSANGQTTVHPSCVPPIGLAPPCPPNVAPAHRGWGIHPLARRGLAPCRQ